MQFPRSGGQQDPNSPRPDNSTMALSRALVFVLIGGVILLVIFPGNKLIQFILMFVGGIGVALRFYDGARMIGKGYLETARSTGQKGMFRQSLVILKRIFLYLLLPAIIITAILIAFAVWRFPEAWTTSAPRR